MAVVCSMSSGSSENPIGRSRSDHRPHRIFKYVSGTKQASPLRSNPGLSELKPASDPTTLVSNLPPARCFLLFLCLLVLISRGLGGISKLRSEGLYCSGSLARSGWICPSSCGSSIAFQLIVWFSWF